MTLNYWMLFGELNAMVAIFLVYTPTVIRELVTKDSRLRLYLPSTYYVGLLMVMAGILIVEKLPPVAGSMIFVGGTLSLLSCGFMVKCIEGNLYTGTVTCMLADVLSIRKGLIVKVRTMNGLFYMTYLHDVDGFAKLVSVAKGCEIEELYDTDTTR